MLLERDQFASIIRKYGQSVGNHHNLSVQQEAHITFRPRNYSRLAKKKKEKGGRRKQKLTQMKELQQVSMKGQHSRSFHVQQAPANERCNYSIGKLESPWRVGDYCDVDQEVGKDQ